jgi:hypothetical protein
LRKISSLSHHWQIIGRARAADDTAQAITGAVIQQLVE